MADQLAIKKTTGDIPVLLQDCNRRYSLFKWGFGFMLLLMTIFVILVGYSSMSASQAAQILSISNENFDTLEKQTNNINSELEKHKELQSVRDQVVLDKLEEIRVELKKLGTKQEEIYRMVLTGTTEKSLTKK